MLSTLQTKILLAKINRHQTRFSENPQVLIRLNTDLLHLFMNSFKLIDLRAYFSLHV